MDSLTSIAKLNHFIRKRNLFAHISIWTIVALVLVSSITVFRGQLIGIIYLTFFLAFLLTFQSSYCLWAKTIKFYCILLIIYSIFVAISLFLFQIQAVHQSLIYYISPEALADIGYVFKPGVFKTYLGSFISTALCLLLVVYLGVFHDDFHRFIYLAAEDDITLSTPLTGSQVAIQQTINDSTFIKLTSNSVDENRTQESSEGHDTQIAKPDRSAKRFVYLLFSRIWRVIEIHYIKVVVFMIFRLPIIDVCFINFPLLLVVIATLVYPSMQNRSCTTASWVVSLIIVSRQLSGLNNLIDNPLKVAINCSVSQNTTNWNDFIGFKPDVDQHIIVLLLITAYTFIALHQTKRSDKSYELAFGVIFTGIGRREADKSIIDTIKYFCNFGFFQLGVEITCLAMIIAICHRLDVIAAIYCVILILICTITSKRSLASVWPIVSILLSLLIVGQYLILMGILDPLCIEYPWKNLNQDLKRWLYLSLDQDVDAADRQRSFLLYDFLVLLAVSRQALVFWHTRTNFSPSHQSYEAAQFRVKYLPNTDEFTIEDYFTNGTTPIKLFKTTFFASIYWITLTAVLVAGATRISLFSLGYLAGCFIFLWLGNDAYLMTIPRLIFSWNWFVLYAVIVMLVKVILQLITCYSTETLGCSTLQLLRVRCYSKDPDATTNKCDSKSFDEMDIVWDGLCLMFLLLQRVIFSTRYFRYLIQEVKAQQILASRGAELIMATQIEEANAQANYEKDVMRSIREKMDDLKTDNEETSKAWQRLLSLPHHHQIIRNADKHLFSTKLDESLDHHRTDDWKCTRNSIPDPLGDELEKMAEINGIDAFFTRWMKGEPIYDKKKHPSNNATPPNPIESGDQVASTSSGVPVRSLDVQSIESDDSENPQDCCSLFNCLSYSCLLSATVKLNKLSRSYRYVSRRMDAEKSLLKREFNLDYERFKRDQIWRKSVINTISENYARASPDTYNLKLNMFSQFCRALGYVVVSNTSLWCQVIIILNQVYSTSLLSLPLALLTFLWGTLSVPRPTKRFWKTIITITELIIMVKYVCRFPVWGFKTTSVSPFSLSSLLGITGDDQGSSIVLDLILLLALFFHRSRLKSLGQWNATADHASNLNLRDASSEESSSPKSNSTPMQSPSSAEHLNKSMNGVDDIQVTGTDQRIGGSVEVTPTRTLSEYLQESYQNPIEGATAASHDGDTVEPDTSSCFTRAYQRVIRSVKLFFDHVLNTPHKVPTDVYTSMFICDFINFLILIYGFWAFGIGYTNQSVTSFINENKIPSSVLFMLLLQFASIMVDRYLYLQKNIRVKLLFQVLLVLGIHIWLFFVLPATTGHNLTFKENWPPKLFYIFKCIYFLLSAQQIRCGYPRRVLGYCFTKGFGYANLIAIKLYRAIPLLYDLRMYMDWIWTETTLEFRNWYIMEDMFANLFIRKCELTLEEEYPTPRAKPQSRISKYLYGGLFILLILLIIWGPLLLFSMGKNVGESNPPVEFEYQLEFVGFEPILKIRASSRQIQQIDDDQYDQLKSGFPSFISQTFLGDYKANDVRIIHLFNQSSSIWNISPPSKKNLLTKVYKSGENITLKSSYSLTRRKKESGGFDATMTGTIEKDIYIALNSTELANILENPSSLIDDQVKRFETPPIFPNFIRVPETGQISIVEALNQSSAQPGRNLSLAYIQDSNTSSTWWNAINSFDNDSDPFKFWPNIGNETLVIVVFSDRIFTGLLALLSAPGIIGLYTTFVFFVARLIRSEPAGKVIYTELSKVDRFYSLIMDIYMMRECGEFELEEKLFAKILYLYRSPELLIEWSRRKDGSSPESSPM